MSLRLTHHAKRIVKPIKKTGCFVLSTSKRGAKGAGRLIAIGGRKTIHHTKRAYHSTVKAGKDTIAYTKLSKEDKKLYNIQRGTKTTFKAFAKAHNKLRSKYKWYYTWHSHPHHKKVHHGVLATFSTAIVILLISTIAIPLNVFASTQSWTFANAGDYTLGNNNSLEVANNSGRLKPNSYATDANTEALYHLNEVSGTTVADSSGNDNTGTAYNIEDGDWGAGKLNNGLSLDGTNEYFSAPDSASLSLTGQNTIEGFTKFDSNFANNTHGDRQTIADKGNYQLYYDNTTGKINYEMEPNTSKTWTQSAGNNLSGSWDSHGKSVVSSVVDPSNNSIMYVGLGTSMGDAEVWKYNGTIWTQLGIPGTANIWSDNAYQNVYSLAMPASNVLYAGIGEDVELWRCDPTANPVVWTKIAGDGINGSWLPSASLTRIRGLEVIGSTLYAGVGTMGGGGAVTYGQVWSWNGSSWTKIAGSSINSGWADADGNDEVFCLETDGTDLYAGVGKYGGAGKGRVWKFTVLTNTWALIGGDGTGAPWASSTYEETRSLHWDGTSLYAGMGKDAGDADVYKYSGGVWTQFAGDGTGWAAATYERVYSMKNIGADLYFALGDTSTDGRIYKYTADGSTWSLFGGNGTGFSTGTVYTMEVYGAGSNIFASLSDYYVYIYSGSWIAIGGNFINKSWGWYSAFGLRSVNCLTSHNGKLYAGNGNADVNNGGGEAQVWEFDGTNWSIIGGQGINSSWVAGTYRGVMSMASYKGNLYAGLGPGGNAEIWKYNGSTWSKIADDDLGISGWTGYDSVYSMAAHNGNLYVGVGSSSGDADLWEYNGSSWTQVAGRNASNQLINSSWNTEEPAALYETIYSLVAHNGKLYAGLGSNSGDAEVWEWTSANDWTKIGGDGTQNSWDSGTTDHEYVRSLAVYNNKLYAGLGNTAGDAEIWSWDGTTWGSSAIGGDGVNSSWTDEYEAVYSMTVYNGELYAGMGNSYRQDAEVWKFNGTSWSKIGGDGTNNSWSLLDSIYGLVVFNGKLFAGIGSTYSSSGSSSAAIYAYGSNAVLSSAATTQDTAWHHVAATYDGSSMNIYIDGVLNASVSSGATMANGTLPLLIGTSYGSPGAGMGAGSFTGLLDEIRISNTARTSFNTSTYTSSAQTITLASAFKTSGVKSWDGFSATTSGGGTVTFRLSHDGGTTWKYYDTGEWKTSASTSQTNTISDINTNIPNFPVTNSGILWQAVLVGNGEEQVALTNVTVEYTPDDSAPSNPTSITGYAEEGSATELTSGQWYDFAAPYFEWSGAMDEGGSGVGGYFVYFGTSAAGVPSEFQTDAHYHATGLVSGSTYYLRIKSRDNAFNPAATVLDAFTYKYNSGGTAPTKPLNLVHQKCVTINEAPNCSGGASTALSPSSINRFSFSWDEPEVVVNGIKKYHYSVNVEPSETNTNSTTNKYLTADAFATQQGKNTLYVVAEDSQGGISWSNYESVDFYASTSAPGAPENVAITDSSNRTAGQYRLTITWTPASSGVTPADYEIYRSTNGNDFASIGTTTSTGYLDSGLSTGTTYYYKVIALDNAGAESASSSAVSKDPTGKFATPPAITTVPVATSGANYIKVVWNTDRVSEGIAECGKTLEYGISGIDLEPKTHHEVTISGLNPDTKYNFRVQSLDPGEFRDYSSTEGRSANYIITTQPAPGMSDVSFSDITTNSAILNFKTTKASTSTINYGTSLNYGSTITDISGGAVTQHSIRFANLTDGTTYQVKISIDDGDGNALSSIGHSFTTIANPAISSLKLQPIDDAPTTTYDVYWTTNVPTSSNAVFTATGRTNKTNSKADLELDHVLRVTDLEDQATYSITVSGRDQYGNYVEQLAPNVTTPIDTREPKVTNLAVEVRASGVGETQKAQVVVSWQTDELSTSMVEYDQGMGGESYSLKSQQDAVYTNNHVVIISELEPSKIYHLRAVSSDKAGNTGSSSDTTVITGKTQKSVLDLILNSLVNSFSWLGKVFK